MVDLIKVNLLPYREVIQQKKKQQFQLLMGIAVAVGLGAAALTYFGISQMISAQEDRNAFLESEIKNLDAKLVEIQKLKAERDEFLARKQKVEELQKKRYEAARVIDTLNSLIPDGVYLTSINAKDATNYQFTGKATGDNRIAMFMRVIPSTGLFSTPELQSIKKVDNAQEFTLGATLQHLPDTTADGSNAANTAPAAASDAGASASQPSEQSN